MLLLVVVGFCFLIFNFLAKVRKWEGIFLTHILTRCHRDVNLRPLIIKSRPFFIGLDPFAFGLYDQPCCKLEQ